MPEDEREHDKEHRGDGHGQPTRSSRRPQAQPDTDPVPAVAFVRDGELVIRPVNPLNGVSPGQSAVIYVGTRVLGQCTIDRTVSAVPVPVPAVASAS